MDPLNDGTDEIDREIERLLAVDPHVTLRAQVRARIEDERSGGWRIDWRLAGAAAVAVMLIASLTLFQPEAQPDQATASPHALVPSSPEVAGVAATSEPMGLKTSAIEGRARPSTDGNNVRTRVPAGLDVLSPPDEKPALLSLVAALRDGRIDPAALDDLQEPLEPLELAPEIIIDPIIIKPLARLDQEDPGDHQ